MKAAVFSQVGKLSIEEKAIPDIGPEEALVKVAVCGICGSDIHAYKSGLLFPIGTIMGHEFTGVLEKVGAKVQNHKIGDRVVVFPSAPCRRCAYCFRGKENLCHKSFERSVGEGLERDGAYAEYVRILWPNEMLYKLPDSVSFAQGALVEPLATGFHAVRQSRFRPGDQVVVLGAGPIGLSAIQFLKIGGAGKIITVEISSLRAEIAKSLGADVVLDPLKEKDALADKVAELTGGLGADIVFECTGVQAAFSNSIALTSSGGQIMAVGVIEHETPIDPFSLLIKEVELRGSFGYTSEEFQMVINFLNQGRIQTQALLSDTIPLMDIEEKGFKRLMSRPDAVKILVKP
ncbi:MAG: zinc-binding dehydrogenase [Deltaproteobacteria bacterium]|nr:zinc-binding dehydrogenase [Deltaproteobacteria bacterium]